MCNIMNGLGLVFKESEIVRELEMVKEPETIERPEVVEILEIFAETRIVAEPKEMAEPIAVAEAGPRQRRNSRNSTGGVAPTNKICGPQEEGFRGDNCLHLSIG